MNSIELGKRIKQGIIDNLYLFYGDEDYIKDSYIEKIKNIALANDLTGMNLTRFDDPPSRDELIAAVESAPVFCEKKVVVLNGLGILSSSLKKELKDTITDIISDIPPYTVLIIREFATDKKKVSKAMLASINKKGIAVECNYLAYHDMVAFINRQFSRYKKRIRKDDLEYFISICGASINSILRELEKICNYAGDTEIIERDMIDLLVKKSVEDRVFSLSDAIISKNKKLAYSILNDLILLKNQHPATQIYAIICDHFLNLYVTVNNYKQRISNEKTVDMLGLAGRAFLIRKYLQQGSAISTEKLRKIIDLLSTMDYQIKTGVINPYYAIDKIIAVV